MIFMRYLGIDYGAKRVGAALSDDKGMMAFPHATLSNDGTLLEEVVRICHEFSVGTVVIGESRQLNGEPNQIQRAIERFKEKLTKALTVPVVFELEFMTSRQASHIQGETDMLDASAAAIILQSYLDKHKHATS